VATLYLGLGTNLGDRHKNLRHAVEMLEDSGLRIARGSSVYETEPIGLADQPWFLNQVIEAETELSAPQVLQFLLATEAQLGRTRSADPALRFGPRLIDLDLLLHGQEIIQTPELIVPHPRIADRRFVLEPLLEIAPELRDPVSQLRYSEILAELVRSAGKNQKVHRLTP
jgi:2-amino-4-hydroxy-6-hydroxymethyldihydropteridine diphosphokinase